MARIDADLPCSIPQSNSRGLGAMLALLRPCFRAPLSRRLSSKAPQDVSKEAPIVMTTTFFKMTNPETALNPSKRVHWYPVVSPSPSLRQGHTPAAERARARRRLAPPPSSPRTSVTYSGRRHRRPRRRRKRRRRPHCPPPL